MNDLCFAIGILSWRGYDSLENSLKSYKKNGLSQMTKYKFVCLPEYTQEGIKIAEKYNYEPILINENLGILGGFKKLAEKMPKGPLLLLENDLELIENKKTTYNEIKKSIDLLYEPNVIQIRLRSTIKPGDPFVGKGKYKKYWSNNPQSYLKRIFRPFKAKRLIGDSIYVLENPEKRHPRKIKRLSDGFFLVSSSILPWTNQSILVDKTKYLEIIIKKAESIKSSRGPTGFKNVEVELNSYWWRKNEFKIIVAPGLFTHKRLSDRGY